MTSRQLAGLLALVLLWQSPPVRAEPPVAEPPVAEAAVAEAAVAEAAVAPDERSAGHVVATAGVLAIQRGEIRQAAVRSMSLQSGDRLVTGDGAGAILFWQGGKDGQGGLSIYMGGRTEIMIAGKRDLPVVKLVRGEVKLTVALNQGMILHTPMMRTHVPGGIVRAAIAGEKIRVQMEQGAALCLATPAWEAARIAQAESPRPQPKPQPEPQLLPPPATTADEVVLAGATKRSKQQSTDGRWKRAARIFESQGRLQKAADLFREVLQRSPGDAGVRQRLALLNRRLGNPVEPARLEEVTPARTHEQPMTRLPALKPVPSTRPTTRIDPRRRITLHGGEQLTFDVAEGFHQPKRSDPSGWQLDVDRLQLAAAAGASRAQRGRIKTTSYQQPKPAAQKKDGKKKPADKKKDGKKKPADKKKDGKKKPADKKKDGKKKDDKKKDDKKKDDKKKDDKKKDDKKKDEPEEPGTRGGEEATGDDELDELLGVLAASSGEASTGTGSVSLSLGATLRSSASGAAGGLFTDANQNTIVGIRGSFDGVGLFTPASPAETFPGNIFPVTSQTTYTLTDVQLDLLDGFPISRQYWSIGQGDLPSGQVTTGFGTGTSAVPEVIEIPQFAAFLVHLDQYGIVDPASDTAAGNQSVSISGLLGLSPSNPSIQGITTILQDERAAINDRATFALGEIAVGRDGDNPEVSIRRSDQDRIIIKDAGGNASLDQVAPNAQVTEFLDEADPLFFPSNPTVKVPGRGPDVLSNRPAFRKLGFLRKAAVTTLMADQLRGYARRTGQTRFVVDGKILDITGYRGP